MVITKYSNEFNEQMKYKKKDERSMVHPLLIRNQPELFVSIEDVVESFFESEEIAWKKVVNSPFPVSLDSSGSFHQSSGCTTPSGCTSIPDTDNIIELIGDAFLRHEKSLEEIHFYFWKLDPRRNCVKKVDEHIGVSQPLKLLESGPVTRDHRGSNKKRSTKKKQWTNPLSPEEREIYKQLLKCALHPPLDEPMPSESSRGMSRNPSAHVDAVSIEHNRLIQKPMRAFYINHNLHDKLKDELLKKLPRRDVTMALTTELMDQMARLECNECMLYQPNDFASADLYEEWRRQKIDAVNRLIWKWCPNRSCTLMAQIARTVNSHEAFKVIVEKFLHLDLREKDDAINLKISIKTVTSILTTESRKLLNEFCLWYGIDEIYRQLVILHAMAEILSLNISDWYLECLLLAFKETMDFINEKKNYLVKAEKVMAESIFNRITDQIKDGFINLFCIYKNIISVKGIETMVLLLQQVHQATYFFRLMDKHESIDTMLKTYIQSASTQHYRILKESAEYDHRRNEGNHLTSPSIEVLRQMLQDIKKCVNISEDITNNCPLLAQKCVDVPCVVANQLYNEFMADVKELCLLNTDTIETSGVNYGMMGLAFRLDKLDIDWMKFIPPEKQKWRRYFKIVLDVSIKAITQYLQVDVTNYILKDESEILQLHLYKSSCYTQPVTCSPQELSQRITLSDASAFTTVKSSSQSPVTSHSSIKNIKLIKNSLRRGSGIDIECKLNGDGTMQNVSVERTAPEGRDEHENEADTTESSSELDTVVMNDTEVMSSGHSSNIEEYIEIYKHHENNLPFNDPLLEDTVRTLLRDVINIAVENCEGDLIESSTTNLQCNIDETTPLVEDTVNSETNNTNANFQVEDTYKNNEYDRRCYSEPINSCVKGKQSNTKLSAAAIRYVRDGPSLDCSNNPTYPPRDIICNFVLKDGGSCSEVDSSIYSDECFIQNNEFPENGQILTTSSVTDVLIACSRLISFANTIRTIVVPSCHSRNVRDLNHENYNIRVDIFLKVLSSIKDVLQSYATNIISLDNCGSKLFRTIQNQGVVRRGSSALPGCRHIREKVKPVNNSQDGRPCSALKRLLDESFGKWELVTRQMCFRINNVYSIITVMPMLQKKVADGMEVDLEQLLCRIGVEQNNEFNCYNKCPCKTPGKSFCRDFALCHVYYSKILHMQVKLLTCRVMDIYNKLFNELRSLPRKQRSICEQMRSCLKYLRSQMKFFRHALYEKCLHLVVVQICKLIVDKFHELLDELCKYAEDPHVKVMNLKDLFMCTIRYLDADNDLKQQINKELQVILFRFQLFFLPLDNIRSLFDVMEDMRTKRTTQHETYIIEELIYLVKRELDKNGKSVFNGSHFQHVLLNNESWLNEFVRILGLDVNMDIAYKIKAIGSYLLRENYMKCCSIIANQSSNLQVLVRPSSLPKDIAINLHTEGPHTATQIVFPGSDDIHQFEKSYESVNPIISSGSRESSIFIEEPYIGSECFFTREDVNYRFETKGETFSSLLLLLLTGELYNMCRENGEWVESVVRKDMITIFSYAYRMNRTDDAMDFFATYNNIRPIYPRRGSCFW